MYILSYEPIEKGIHISEESLKCLNKVIQSVRDRYTSFLKPVLNNSFEAMYDPFGSIKKYIYEGNVTYEYKPYGESKMKSVTIVGQITNDLMFYELKRIYTLIRSAEDFNNYKSYEDYLLQNFHYLWDPYHLPDHILNKISRFSAYTLDTLISMIITLESEKLLGDYMKTSIIQFCYNH